MSTTEQTCPAIMPAAVRPATGFWSNLLHLVAVRRNRRKVARLENLSDTELRDIGLSRLELRVALSESRFFEDPSRFLSRSTPRRGA